MGAPRAQIRSACSPKALRSVGSLRGRCRSHLDGKPRSATIQDVDVTHHTSHRPVPERSVRGGGGLDSGCDQEGQAKPDRLLTGDGSLAAALLAAPLLAEVLSDRPAFVQACVEGEQSSAYALFDTANVARSSIDTSRTTSARTSSRLTVSRRTVRFVSSRARRLRLNGNS
jgi:hypothetical protein